MATDLYVPGQRYKWLEFIEEGSEDDTIIRVRVRTSLTVAEYNGLVIENGAPMTEAYEKYAPYVMEWNVAEVNDKGKVVPVPAPASGGPDMFTKIPNALFIRLAQRIRATMLKDVDPKSSPPPNVTAMPSSDGSTMTG